MKILQVITLSELGGAQSVVVNLSNALCCQHEVVVAAGGSNGGMWELLDCKITKEPINCLKRELSLFYDLLTLFLLLKLYFKYKPDIIHLHSSKIGILGRIAFPKNKIVYTVHGFDSIRIAYNKYLSIERLLQNNCKAIVAVSEYDRINLLKENIQSNIHLIHNGINKPLDLYILEDLPFSSFEKKVLCIARAAKPKRMDIFIETAKLLPQYAFIWIGNIEKIESPLPNIFFMGNIPNAGKYNHIVDLFMLSSDFEGLPVVILEAMACGKPIVASKVGGISEIVIDGRNGYVVDNIPDAFADKIRYILDNSDICHDFGAYSRKFFDENLTIDKMVNKYVNIYTL